ncbi:MAG: FtsK/SpoIIIE domain-containing protein, partial [Nocardioides sp.]
MRVMLTVVDAERDNYRDLVIDADPETPIGEVSAAIDELLDPVPTAADARGEVISLRGRRHRLPDARGPELYFEGKPLEPTTTLRESGLVEGAVLAIGRPVHVSHEPVGLVEIRVVSGPDAGTVHRLTIGDATIGSDPSCVIPLPSSPALPAVCAVATIRADGEVTLRAADTDDPTEGPVDGSGDGSVDGSGGIEITVDREAVSDESRAWPAGGQVLIGDSRLELEQVTSPDAAVHPGTEPGFLDYNRPPRLQAEDRTTRFRLPSAPKPPRSTGIPWLICLAPLVIAAVFVYVRGSWQFALFGLMSPIMLLGNYFQGRKSGKKDHKLALAEFARVTEAVEDDVARAIVEERHARRLEAPDPAQALLIASGPRARLWERRPTDPDYLCIRIGVGDLPSEVTVDDPEQLEHKRQTVRTAFDVPITVSLRERGVLGIAATGETRHALGHWLLAQLAVLQSPRDTWCYVLTSGEQAADWAWLRWLPHARPQAGQDTVATLGTDTESCARRIAELVAIIDARLQGASTGAARAAGRSDRRPADIVVVFDGARRLRVLPGAVNILKQGPSVGVYSICLDTDERLLPEEASAVAVGPAGDPATAGDVGRRSWTLRQDRTTLVTGITADLVRPPWLERLARAMAPLRDISGSEADSVLPSSCRLTEVLGLEPLGSSVIKTGWALRRRSTAAVVGLSLDGPFALDLRRDGPHGLVAGTTGAGKSELLQTLVASLAVANTPAGMNFVLVDYKGGAAFGDCVDLPHTVGMVTDLDTHLVERALVSLGAELTRREHLLAEVGAKDIEDYHDLAAKWSANRSVDLGVDLRAGTRVDGAAMVLPRLVIVIDEFASLARDLPDFVTGLVNIAQRGRSLGIHLILATQRPGGVVSPEIRANTNLRIALRVTDAAESTDVIDAKDAAAISKSTPGRAYVRLGAASLVPFQAGRVGGRRPGSAAVAGVLPWVYPVDPPGLAQPVPAKPVRDSDDDVEETDLKSLVAAIRRADEELEFPAQHSPWLPALPTSLLLASLIDPTPAEASQMHGETSQKHSEASPRRPGELPVFPYGLEDRPAEQVQRLATIDLRTFSHLSIVGGPRSGRSQVLRTMAAAMATMSSPEDVQLYGIDCGNGALLPLTELPHCGAVVQRAQTERVHRLLDRLRAEVARRQERLAAGGYADLTELRASVESADRLPHLFLLLDRWEGFMSTLAESNGGSPYEDVLMLLREGASLGIHLILAGDRSVVSSRLSALVEDKLALRLPEKSDFGLVGLSPRKLPDTIADGRGFRSDSAIEVQVALIDADTSGQAQAAALRELGRGLVEKYAGLPRDRGPFRVDVLPSALVFDEAWALLDPGLDPRLDPGRDDSDRRLWAMLGVGGDQLGARGLDLDDSNAAVVAGPPKSGRSTALMVIAESVLRGGSDIVIATPRPSPLRTLAGRPGVRGIVTGAEWTTEELRELIDP